MTINENTVAVYNKIAKEYFLKEADDDAQNQAQLFLNKFCKSSKTLDVGSGNGKFSKLFADAGNEVTMLDPASELLKLAVKATGLPSIACDITKFDKKQIYDGIWACASLHHLPSVLMKQSFSVIANALVKNGVFVASFKQNEKDRTDGSDRFFAKITQEIITESAIEAGFSVEKIVSYEGKGTDGEKTIWLWLTAKKM